MASLVHNQTFRILEGEMSGIYRVVLVEIPCGLTAVAHIQKDLAAASETSSSDGAWKKSKPALCGQLMWLQTELLNKFAAQGILQQIELERENFKDSPAAVKQFERRKMIMSDFLDFDLLHSSIRACGTVADLANKAMETHGASRTMVYTCWSLLCRYGFAEESLRLRFDRCGAPGTTKDCAPSGRRKAGRKTNRERLARQLGEVLAEVQPGMSEQWRQLIMLADRRIPSPKPRFHKRFLNIIEEGFTKLYRESKAELVPMPLEQGTYPNKDQVRRVLFTEIPQIERLRQKTTTGHFQRSMRGMIKRSWKGVLGPGHTWQIDSTRADIYLRSSINRAWIVGRPILYIMVDVWSTAIVGFYLCLRGPSWEMAKTALFSSVSAPGLLGELWGYEPMETLNPHPGVPAVLLCDRGEYISQAAKQTAFRLIERLDLTPPYRPDLKGLVEVQHRITKDEQAWIPGAIDARRAEFELRKFDPRKAIFTIAEYAAYLHVIFSKYNLTADRTRRLDTSMIADGVTPSPAGLWRWGHEVGIGKLGHRPQSELISLLLPEAKAKVTRDGVGFDGMAYTLDDAVMSQLTAKARNFGSWEISVHHFPGSVSRIWTPNVGGTGLLELGLSDQANASRTQTYEEVMDAFAYQKLTIPELQHDRVSLQLDAERRAKKMVESANERTIEAIAREKGPTPSLSEARALEAIVAKPPVSQALPNHVMQVDCTEEEPDAYLEMMKSVLKAKGAQ